jgi:hypothetical protein
VALLAGLCVLVAFISMACFAYRFYSKWVQRHAVFKILDLDSEITTTTDHERSQAPPNYSFEVYSSEFTCPTVLQLSGSTISARDDPKTLELGLETANGADTSAFCFHERYILHRETVFLALQPCP